MSQVFIMGDTHYCHKSAINFPGRKGRWDTMQEHDEDLLQRSNSVLTKRDILLLAGDVGFDRPSGSLTAKILPRLICKHKYIIMGNHDTYEVARCFDKIYGSRTDTILGYRVIITHIPVHPQEMFWDINIHGHTHDNVVRVGASNPEESKAAYVRSDNRYICVSAEHMNFTPRPIIELVEEHLGKHRDDIDANKARTRQFKRDKLR